MSKEETINWKHLICSILIANGVGGASQLITRGSMKQYAGLIKPPLAPPGWVFGVVWPILFLLMAIAAYLVYESGEKEKRKALIWYGIQLFFNFCWPIAFFNLSAYWFAFAWLIVLWVMIIITTTYFFKIEYLAGWLMIPYLLWTTYAAYLNAGIALLNP